MLKKILLVCSLFLLGLLLFFAGEKLLNRMQGAGDASVLNVNPEIKDRTDSERRGVASENKESSHDKPVLNIGFLSTDSRLQFADSNSLQAYLEKEFDFNFENLSCDFTFTHLTIKDSLFLFDDKMDVIFADSALDWEEESESTYSLKNLYRSGYRLKNFSSYFEGKKNLFSSFHTSLKAMMDEKIYFYPALVAPDTNRESLFVSLDGSEDAVKEPVMSMEPFYNDEYYFIKRGGPEKGRFKKDGAFTISANSPFLLTSFFKQTVYVTSDNPNAELFLNLVFDSNRLQKQYEHKLKRKGNQIENHIPTIQVDHLSDLFQEVLLKNVKYDLDSIYKSKDVRITYIY